MKAGNSISEYLWGKLIKRNPGDTINALAKRINVNHSQLYRSFKAKNSFNQAIVLMRICTDLGITMEEAVLGTQIKASKEAEYWKQKYEQSEKEKMKIENNRKKLVLKIKKILED